MKKEYEKSITIKGLANVLSITEALSVLHQLQAIFKITVNDGYYHIKDSDVLCICNRGKSFYLTVINGGSIAFRKNNKDYSPSPVVLTGTTVEEVVDSLALHLRRSYCCVIYVTEQRSEMRILPL